MSLRWRIMASIVSVILLTVVVSLVVGYFTTQARLGVFVEDLGDSQASRLAQNLSRELHDGRRLADGGPPLVRGRIPRGIRPAGRTIRRAWERRRRVRR